MTAPRANQLSGAEWLKNSFSIWRDLPRDGDRKSHTGVAAIFGPGANIIEAAEAVLGAIAGAQHRFHRNEYDSRSPEYFSGIARKPHPGVKDDPKQIV